MLPLLFESLGAAGPYVSLVFFLLMTIAALTSSISMLECPVALASERLGSNRKLTSWVLGGLIAALSAVIVFHFGTLFGLVAKVATQYFQPFAALLFCLFGGWIWARDRKLSALREGYEEIEQSLFWKIWPAYVKFVCPILVATVLWVSLG